METSGFSGLLTAIVFLPLVGAILIALALRSDRSVRLAAGIVSLAEFVLAIVVFALYKSDVGGVQLVDKIENWIPGLSGDTFAVQYFLGVDGLSAPLVLLTGIIGLVSVYASWHIKVRVREYFMWLLALQTGVMGVFISLDFLMFFLFWEIELIPMFFLIAIWGSDPKSQREYSAMKFLIFTILGSAFMLVAIVAVSLTPEVGTFDMVELSQAGSNLTPSGVLIPLGALFWLFFVAFAIKLPTWPVHTWLPDAHTDAPTAASVMLAGVLLKMGGYGLLRINVGMFPSQADRYAWALITLGVVSVLYGAVVTLRQTDLKRLIAYSSVSHMGLVLVGIGSIGVSQGELTVTGLNGAAMQLFTHGTITGLLFLGVGLVYDKAHTRYIPDLGGLADRMPFVVTALLIAGLASLGLPGLSGFVSELLVFLGAFRAYPWPTALAVMGIVLAAGYILWMMERAFFGEHRERFSQLTDASLVEALPMALLVISIVGIGVYPAILTDVFEMGLQPMVAAINGGR